MNPDLLLLQNDLFAAGIVPESYSIGEESEERYCLLHEGAVWQVFYFERGMRRDRAEFASVGAASAHLRSLLVGDPTSRVERS